MTQDSQRLLLIDGDIEAYRASAVAQEKIEWSPGEVSTTADEEQAVSYLKDQFEFYRNALESDNMVVALSHGRNFRKELVWPEYKANRKDAERPVLLEFCRSWLRENRKTETWESLEADDVLGLLSCRDPRSVIVSIDKDMLTVPGYHFNPGHPQNGVFQVGVREAERAHFMQVLAGDATDGYSGVPGIGPKKAERIIERNWPDVDPRQSVHDQVYVYVKGREKLWKSIVEAYEKKGLTKENALTTARLAYILHRPGDYDRETGEPFLWLPPPAHLWLE